MNNTISVAFLALKSNFKLPIAAFKDIGLEFKKLRFFCI